MKVVLVSWPCARARMGPRMALECELFSVQLTCRKLHTQVRSSYTIPEWTVVLLIV